MVSNFHHCDIPTFFKFQLAFEHCGNISAIQNSANTGKELPCFLFGSPRGSPAYSTLCRWLHLLSGFMKGAACHGKGSPLWQVGPPAAQNAARELQPAARVDSPLLCEQSACCQ
jgi:hypothetical protein